VARISKKVLRTYDTREVITVRQLPGTVEMILGQSRNTRTVLLERVVKSPPLFNLDKHFETAFLRLIITLLSFQQK
jgi:hypothetical protein